ncbi:multiple epidermal growth factor-like domains protein 11 [Pomacea canaliculata]|uniref:multiple epidermal growth factor-like domains protein 11 n=1 Tax=Pomacea canaliculata TaxID=400727 RepID=UPI000D73B059|nr:multiple epidermal growth factor-like domains protein 11 [Pomacea canaliculata]
MAFNCTQRLRTLPGQQHAEQTTCDCRHRNVHEQMCVWTLDWQTRNKQCASGTFGAKCAKVGAVQTVVKRAALPTACAPGRVLRIPPGRTANTGAPACAGDSCLHCKGSHGQCLLPQGACQDGCQAGWFGRECRLRCPPGTHGVNCSRDCGRCLERPGGPGAGCDAETGSCADAGVCEAGWTGDRCDKACSPGTYGRRCSAVCGACANASTCSSVSGDCPAGCQNLRRGTDCQTPCAACASPSCIGCKGSFGQCLSPEGTCLQGCTAGWAGAECRYKCPAGTHGVNCTRDCGHCLDNSTQEQTTCDAVTGECPRANVCLDGWTANTATSSALLHIWSQVRETLPTACAPGGVLRIPPGGLPNTVRSVRGDSCLHCKGSHGQLLAASRSVSRRLPGRLVRDESADFGARPGTHGVNCSRDCGSPAWRGLVAQQVQGVTRRPGRVQTLACAKLAGREIGCDKAARLAPMVVDVTASLRRRRLCQRLQRAAASAETVLQAAKICRRGTDCQNAMCSMRVAVLHWVQRVVWPVPVA